MGGRIMEYLNKSLGGNPPNTKPSGGKGILKKESYMHGFMPKSEPKKVSPYRSIGQRLYDIVGAEIGRSGGISFLNKGGFAFPVNKDWGVSGWYDKKPKGSGFNKSDYDFGLSIGRKL